ncbi:hypothetical protein JCM18905_2362 [Vibrio sp. JCM 18905]|nr:hypothetical protein JCM18905_2362 [Vibrio sp. JCM 18905]
MLHKGKSILAEKMPQRAFVFLSVFIISFYESESELGLKLTNQLISNGFRNE